MLNSFWIGTHFGTQYETQGEIMPYLLKRGDSYYYNRRVPKSAQQFDRREKVKLSLNTDSQKVAEQRSISLNEEIERYWMQLIEARTPANNDSFDHITGLAQKFGFTYKPVHELAEGQLTDILARLKSLEVRGMNQIVAEAKLGGATPYAMTVSQALDKFWAISTNEIVDKSEQQKRKWRNPIKKATRNFIACVGNIELIDLHRDHIIQFRDSWIKRIERDAIAVNTVNKEIRNLKKVISTVCDHLKLDIDHEWLFRNYSLSEHNSQIRAPFESEYIQQELLNLDNLINLNKEAKSILYVMAELGARPSEIIGLLPEEIILSHDIPHITIRPRKGHNLKSRSSERKIPIVGYALWAFQQCPEGFPRYRESQSGADNFSNTVNKFLRSNGLLPTKNHSIYSLRHSFQDRLTNVGVPDRVQCQLMGHKFEGRIEYGLGASLETKQQWLQKICFQAPDK